MRAIIGAELRKNVFMCAFTVASVKLSLIGNDLIGGASPAHHRREYRQITFVRMSS